MKNWKRNAILAATLVAFLGAGNAFALSLQDAKAQGLVGEKNDGYLGVVKDGPGVAALVSEINGKRKQFYQETAAKTKASVSSVEQVAGTRAISETPSGQMVNTGGGWTKK